MSQFPTAKGTITSDISPRTSLTIMIREHWLIRAGLVTRIIRYYKILPHIKKMAVPK